jgi:hypothetical protein
MEYLCHYTNEKKAKLIIENMTLRFGKIFESNDPIEIKDFTNFSRTKEIDDFIKCIKNELKSYLDNILQLLCFSKGEINNIDEHGFETGMENDIINGANIQTFMKRPPYYLPRMWAQYGNNHKGVCLIFNKNNLIKQVKNQTKSSYHLKYKEIIYKDIVKYLLSEQALSKLRIYLRMYPDKLEEPISIVQEVLHKNNELDYFVKDMDWKDEREYRFLLWNKIKNNNYDNKIIYVDKESLIGVVFGLYNNSSDLIKLSSEQKIKNLLKLEYDGDSINLYKIENKELM